MRTFGGLMLGASLILALATTRFVTPSVSASIERRFVASSRTKNDAAAKANSAGRTEAARAARHDAASKRVNRNDANPGAGRVAAPLPTIVKVNPDGTFTPQNVTIKLGSKIMWESLGRTDAIVQIAKPGSYPGEDVCGLTDNLLDHRFDGRDANEFTGPTRYGVSGIFALGPDGPGFVQVPLTTTCDCELPGNTCKPAAVITSKLKLCPEQGLPNEVLDRTWTNPDVTGVTIRLAWRDLQKDTGGQIEYVWTDLDRQMNRAVQNGKLFTLDVRAGSGGTPDWIFTNYGGPGLAPPGPVTPLFFKDWADGDTPENNNCGFRMPLGSPTHIAYLNLWTAMLRALANHVASDSRWFQSLAHVKVSGANFISSEARLPKRAYDSDDPDLQLDTVGVDPCIANPQRWADASYTPDGLYKYYRAVENAIYEDFFRQKSMGYQLIQAGFPRVTSPTNFEGDSLSDQNGVPLVNPVGTTGDDIKGTVQTEAILQEGRDGRFVDPYGVGSDSVAGDLFVPQHSGLQTLPDDLDPTHPCYQHQPVLKNQQARFPSNVQASQVPDDDTNGCPNAWAVREGLNGTPGQFLIQLTGFQTTNDHNPKGPVGNPAGVESALWNLTINSNAVFIELYEQRLWEISELLGTGPTARVLDPGRRTLPATNPAPYTKNLNAWANELHDRRKVLAGMINSKYFADPFPTTYEHAFSQPISKPTIYFYINPSKCVKSAGGRNVGSITVLP